MRNQKHTENSLTLSAVFPVGKIPPEALFHITQSAPVLDPRIVLGPGIGLDCGIIDLGDRYLVMKTDPITFASEEIGWYAVQIIANDIATCGAKPRWMMVTALFPEGRTDQALLDKVCHQLFAACREMGISVINGHTEITYGIDRPILSCAMVGEVAKDKLITPKGAKPGNAILITKSIPIEMTALLASEFPERLKPYLTDAEIADAKNYPHNPGIGVSKDAQVALNAGRITAMHDPTEGGIAAALWEMSEACGYKISMDSNLLPITPLSKKICRIFDVNPFNSIASGALLLSCEKEDVPQIIQSLETVGIPCTQIGNIEHETAVCIVDIKTGRELPRPQQDEVARIFTK